MVFPSSGTPAGATCPSLRLFGVEILDVSDVRRRLERDGPFDVDPGARERLHLARIVRQQPNSADSEEAKAASGSVVGPCVRRKAEAAVGVDGVRAVFLKHVRAQLVHEPDPTSLMVGGVDEDTAPFRCNFACCLSKLRAAVAAKRPERVTGQTLRVEPGQDRAALADVAAHEREIHPSGSKLERA